MPVKHPKMDRLLVSLVEPWERRRWVKVLGVTLERLREAMAAKGVGRSVAKLRAYMSTDRFARGDG